MIFSFSGCSEPPRPDFSMLSESLSAVNEKYHFEYFDMFLYEGAYHVYLSLASQDDVLLSMVFGENGNIDSVTVVADKEKSDSANGRKAYMDFVSAVIDSFSELTEKNKRSFMKKSVSEIRIYILLIYMKAIRRSDTTLSFPLIPKASAFIVSIMRRLRIYQEYPIIISIYNQCRRHPSLLITDC